MCIRDRDSVLVEADNKLELSDTLVCVGGSELLIVRSVVTTAGGSDASSLTDSGGKGVIPSSLSVSSDRLEASKLSVMSGSLTVVDNAWVCERVVIGRIKSSMSCI